METGLELGFNDVIKADKKKIGKIASNMLIKAKEGDLDPVEAFSAARKGKEFFSQMEDGLRPLVEKDLKLAVGKDYRHNSVLFEGAITKTSYDYTACNDPEWNEIDEAIKTLTEKRKERETFLKGVKKKFIYVNEDTGEESEIHPPIKSETEGIKVTLK